MRLPLLAALITLTVTSTGLEAQRPYRSGWWIENGVGTGTIRIGCSNCATPTVAFGESSYLRFGRSLSPRVLIGWEGFTLLDKTYPFGAQDSLIRLENNSAAIIVMWYPWRSGLFFKGGTGLAYGRFTLAADQDAPVVAQGIGSALTFGAGFDIPIFKWLSVTANFGSYFTALGDVTVQGRLVDDAVATMYNANFALTIR